MAKAYTIVPEFKISDQIDYYVDKKGGNFRALNNKILNLEGAATVTASADNQTASVNNTFFEEYCSSDFQKYFGTFSDDEELSSISLKCNVIKKLLPYNGFYPVNRCLQLGTLLSQSVGDYLGGLNWLDGDFSASAGEAASANSYLTGALAIQSLMQPFFAPGVMYNTIKSGIAVDYPVFTGSVSGNIRGVSGESDFGAFLTASTNYRIPFEAMVAFRDYVPMSSSNGEGRISLVNTQVPMTRPGAYERLPYMEWNGQIKPMFEMATNNFFAEVPNFFLQNNKFTTITSAPENQFKAFVSGKCLLYGHCVGYAQQRIRKNRYV